MKMIKERGMGRIGGGVIVALDLPGPTGGRVPDSSSENGIWHLTRRLIRLYACRLTGSLIDVTPPTVRRKISGKPPGRQALMKPMDGPHVPCMVIAGNDPANHAI
jgi:hypothetical protein